MQINELGEFGLIDLLTANIETHSDSTLVGVGDDCAVLQPSAGMRTLVTTDMLLEGIHFDLQYVPLTHLGYKAAQVNFSDIYAMGGMPRQITVSLGISSKFSVEDIQALYEGLSLACREHQVDIVGGDTCASMNGLTVSVTCIGDASPDDIVRRSGAADTDLVCVSGDLGAAYMGLQLLEREKAVYNQQYREWQQSAKSADAEPPQFQPDFAGREYLLQRQLRPEARRDIIIALHEAGIHPTAMMDISDGLSSELLHICKASACGCRIYEERIPLDYQTAVTAEEFNMNVTTAAMNGGEDYELLFTVPLADHERIQNIAGVKVIGHITKPEHGHILVTRDEAEFNIKAQGWQAKV